MAKGKPKDEPQEDDSESGSSHDGAKSDQETEPPPSGPLDGVWRRSASSATLTCTVASANRLSVCHAWSKPSCCCLCDTASTAPTPLPDPDPSLGGTIPWGKNRVVTREGESYREPERRICLVCLNVWRALGQPYVCVCVCVRVLCWCVCVCLSVCVCACLLSLSLSFSLYLSVCAACAPMNVCVCVCVFFVWLHNPAHNGIMA